MPISMTGFGRSTSDTPLGALTIEIQSVNRKFLDMYIVLPKELSRFELECRKWVSDAITRGLITLRVFLVPNTQALQELLPDMQLLKSLKEQWSKIAKDLQCPPVDLPFIMQYLPTINKTDIASDSFLPHLKQCTAHALQSLLKMKAAEGKNLTKDLQQRLSTISGTITQIEKLTPNAAEKMRQKLSEKIAEIAPSIQESDERLLKEIALFAERVDVSEEITRLKSHIAQFEHLFKEEIVGRKMEFLMQEIMREANTIASKAMDAQIAHHVVDIKSELEKMREQIQNIE